MANPRLKASAKNTFGESDNALQEAAAGSDAELIRASDFETSRLRISVTNTTTQTKSKPDAGIQIVELGDQALVLEVPPRTCSRAHHLLVEMTLHRPARKPVSISATCKVDALESLPDGTDQITVSLVQYDEKEWEIFCSNFSSRQQEIEEFFKSAKGY